MPAQPEPSVHYSDYLTRKINLVLMLISIVVPVYNSEKSLDELVSRVQATFADSPDDAELIFVDDNSKDGSWEVLTRLRSQHPKGIKIIRLLVNCGQHNAILCGFNHVNGDVVVTMDDDLQNPPEDIPLLVKPVVRGYDLCIGAYVGKKHNRVKNFFGELIDNTQRLIFKLPSDFKLTSFRAVRRSVVNNVIKSANSYPYITSMLLSNSSNRLNVSVRHEPRKYGTSNYRLGKNISLALNLIFSYSTLPIYAVVVLCSICLLCSVGYGLYVLMFSMINGSSVPGWTSTIVAVSLFSSFNLLMSLVFAIYLARLYKQVSNIKQNFVIDEIL